MTSKHTQSPRSNVFLRQVATLLVLVILTSCEFPGFATPVPTPAPTQPIVQETPQAETLVTFYVQVPSNTPADQEILFSLLDEVTGLALNANRYTMEADGDNRYTISLPLAIGSIVKYRYARQAEVLKEEHTSDGRQVRYRLYHVVAPGEVQDVVTRWNDTLYSGLTGRIEGTVRDANSGEPLPGLMVTAGGAQVFTTADGGFLIEGLPPGTHNLVVYALDGSYQTFQQGALVAAESSTPAEISLSRAPLVDVTFLLQVPEGTIRSVPLRLAGNIYQLGNTFANLSGGFSTLAARMPTLNLLPDGSYGLILSLPAGVDLRYKYTLGDGFWNSERTERGEFILRQLIIPDTPVVVEDKVATWSVDDTAPVIFDLNVPESTPEDDSISIQLSPYGWTEPLPMWELSPGRWAYVLLGPFDMINRFGYRYCRADQCGYADDARTPGVFTSGQVLETSNEEQSIPDRVETWAWLDSGSEETYLPDIKIPRRDPAFVAGVEFQTFYHPSWELRMPLAVQDVVAMGANQLTLTPSWSFTRLTAPVLEPVPGHNPLPFELAATIADAQEQGLEVALRPTPIFPTAVDEWWLAAPRDFPWWVSWFDSYRNFILHHADLAAQNGVTTIVLGGDWLNPALPGGKIGEEPSGVPADAELRWREMITEVKARFKGTVAWALPYPEGVLAPPAFIEQVDQIQVLWSAPLAEESGASLEEMQAEANRILKDDIYSLRLLWKPDTTNNDDKSIVISLAYPSVQSGVTGCLPDPVVECIDPHQVDYPAPDLPLLELDLQEQAQAYNAVFLAVNRQDWINGVISRGYYPPVVLMDKSTSVHGKPAATVLHHWFSRFLRGD
jgi:hypothetical protein